MLNQQQQAVVDAAKELKPGGILQIVALPGCGKTTVGLEITKAINPNLSVLYSSFSKSGATEMENRYKKLGFINQSHSFSTIHSFAYGLLRKHINVPISLKLNKYKKLGKRTVEFSELALFDLYRNYGASDESSFHEVTSSYATGGDLGLFVELIGRGHKLTREKGVIDYGDMISHLLLDEVSIRTIDIPDVIIIDEWQDTSVSQWRLIQKLLKTKPALRLILIGDPNQCLYRFAGVDPNLFYQSDNVHVINITYRFGTTIADYVEMETGIHLETTQGGEVQQSQNLSDFYCLDAVISPTHSGLLQVLQGLMAEEIPFDLTNDKLSASVVLATSPDQSIQSLEKRKQSIPFVPSTLATHKAIDRWIDFAPELWQYSQHHVVDNGLVLTSVHGAKGKEWDRVGLYGIEEVNDCWDDEIERQNIRFVALTRARDLLLV